MDHGILNTPLRSRGDIDAQIDAHKAAMARDAKILRKAAASERAVLKVQALELFDAMTPARLDKLAARAGSSTVKVRDHLRSQCHWQPAFVISLLSA